MDEETLMSLLELKKGPASKDQPTDLSHTGRSINSGLNNQSGMPKTTHFSKAINKGSEGDLDPHVSNIKGL